MANSTSSEIISNGRQSNSIEEYTSIEDRLSSLSNPILIKILSHLPILDAIKTSQLSRRWRNVWKGVTTFEFHTRTMKFENAASLLLLLTSPTIRVFKYSYGHSTDYPYWKFRSAEHCYLSLIRRNIEVIQITSNNDDPILVPVPDCVFNCESLVDLDLSACLDWTLKLDEVNDLPSNGTAINLPNLKKLRLRVNDFDYCLLRTLLKFCPVLEDLCLKLDLSNHNVPLEIVSPNLKSLDIDMTVPAKCSDTVIDAPNLAKLKIRDPCSYYRFKTIPASLVEASINFRCFEDGEEVMDWSVQDHARVSSKFIRGMSSVRYLKLHTYPNMHTYFGSEDDEVMPVFHNLTFFKTTMDTHEVWGNLLCTLHCFPNLKHLELKMDDFHISRRRFWCAPIVLPDCLFTKLKRITMKNFKGTNDEIKLVEFILDHAKVLGELHIHAPTIIAYFKQTQLWEECKSCHALFKLSKSFVTCKIVFSGVYINASSNAYKKGLIGCQIRCAEKLVDCEYYAMFR
ncbi:hypothetical protein BVRB_004660 [Beta vulgaris subsp. vulgaris]|uniref:F-box domain-containing protein n=1 Tax=Beta vulgaris subsp. vulgaris TaxID=3555 RepID=A0A0J8B759_BETVV|nr:hypothetical protein BVRB_004660 [Beta vulgaris subsp. vulgaris]